MLDDDNKWILDLLCVGILAALLYSQLKLFQGSWANFFSDDDEESETESKETISYMLEADAVRMVIFLQEKLDKERLHIKEVRMRGARSEATTFLSTTNTVIMNTPSFTAPPPPPPNSTTSSGLALGLSSPVLMKLIKQ